jgi:iron complex outermembrane receptor protein
VGMKVLRILVLLISLSIFANAQSSNETSVLKGLVYDDMSAVITNAEVTFRGADGKVKVVKTNSDGEFEVNLSAGNYSIEVESPGFQTFKLEKYRIAPSYKGKMNLDIVLEVGPCSDCHKIEAPVIQNKKLK